MTPRVRGLAATGSSVLITLFGLVLVTFLIGRVMPIDPVIAIVGDHAPPDVIAQVRGNWGWTGRCWCSSRFTSATWCMAILADR